MNDQVREHADKAFREALRKPDNLRELIRARVPELADGFDFEQMRSVPPKFLLPDGRDREADLLFEIPYRFGESATLALVCVLIEHQTNPDPRIPLRTLLYIVLYWEKKWSEWEALPSPKSEFRLPPVLPIVFHTGATPWGSARSIKDLLGEPEAFHAFAPDWQPLFWELPRHSVEELLSSNDAFLQLLAIVRVEGAERTEFERVFRATWQRLAPLHETNRIRWSDLIYFIIDWITHRRPVAQRSEMFQLAENLATDTVGRNEAAKMVQTFADIMRAEGKEEVLRQLIIRHGTKRWGAPDVSIADALNRTNDIDRLEQLNDRLFEGTAKSWNELLDIG